MTAEAIAKALGGSRTGGTWMASWPAHDDREPSLSIRGANEKSAWWQSVKDGRFPKGRYSLNTRRKLWYEDEVVAWQVAMDGQGPHRRRRRAKKTKPAKQTD